jgi:hypothetical protein
VEGEYRAREGKKEGEEGGAKVVKKGSLVSLKSYPMMHLFQYFLRKFYLH